MTPEERAAIEKKVADFFAELKPQGFIIGIFLGEDDRYYKGAGTDKQIGQMVDEISTQVILEQVAKALKEKV